jgi:hypothetical protein
MEKKVSISPFPTPLQVFEEHLHRAKLSMTIRQLIPWIAAIFRRRVPGMIKGMIMRDVVLGTPSNDIELAAPVVYSC